MLLGIDHLVIAVADPDGAAAELEQRIGLAAGGGGRHPTWGTHNRLVWFGDTYAELIGVFDRTLAPSGAVSRAVVAALDRGAAGLVTYALATDDAAADLARLRATGSDLTDLEARSRTRPDGEIVRWRAAFPASLGPTEPPFIVEHEPIGAEWGPDARAERARFRHPVGGPVRLRRLMLPVADAEAAAGRYRGALGIHLAGDPPEAGLGGQAIRLVDGGQTDEPAVVELVAPGARRIDAVVLGVRWRLDG